ncbi:hypothetical protein ACIQZB_00315 [Streptomyces sp. NPDC097727]|uniref:hypothetical protein n=1 Tax=Streptomyces sp. NPDC097727 TaxID=3366092 RepID=UPI00381676EB
MPATKAFWTEYFNDAYEAAARKRHEVIDRGLLLIAHLIREELPTATAISVTFFTGSLLAAVHDAEGMIWRFNDETTRGKLSDLTRAEIRDTLLDMLNFARTSAPLLAADWKQDKEDADTYRITLHGTPGEDAGNCAQCGRLLIWDGAGKRVNDEWGEYLCYSPRPDGARSAVHTLGAPETEGEQSATQS